MEKCINSINMNNSSNDHLAKKMRNCLSTKDWIQSLYVGFARSAT